MERTSNEGKIPVLYLLKSLLFAYALTGTLLALLSLLLYKMNLGERLVAIGIIVIYAASTFLAGFLAGKRMKSRRFLWGLLEGAAYFLVLALLSFLAGGHDMALGRSFFTTLALCAGGGMLGGMLG
ncbi:MAG: TIGR04086 family membrane protein [Roseburia sp.]|nr:TIGR04086 family membrane protein [Roseburia sp.]MCM1098377.1 TIGR04086 family membrane protein [Ruminococcus flavefaciens]